MKLRSGGIALLLALAATRVQSQPAQPWISLQNAGGGSNLRFQLTTEPGWFYTFEQSTNLTTWGYAARSFAEGTSLSWTNPIGSNSTAKSKFYRVSVNAPNTAVSTNYHSWNNAVSLRNGVVEALIVPTIGRVQQFRFLGDTNNAFWENAGLYGQSPSTSSYRNFGGDRVWPAPQYSWAAGYWPPPTGFDGTVQTGSFSNGVVTLVSPVDSRFGITVTRYVELLFNQPVMQIRTVFTRTKTPSPASLLNSNVSVWIDCQANVTTASRCYVPVPSPSIFANGYTLTGDAYFGPTVPAGFTNANGLISFKTDTAASHKVGFDSSMLVLVGPKLSLRVDAPRVPGATYSAGGCSTEVYTGNFTTDPYFELELLSPRALLPVGGTMEFITTYSLFHRTEATTDAEAQKVLAWQY